MFYHVMNFFDHFFLKAGFHWAIEGDKKKFKFWWKREDYFFRLLSFTFTNYRRNQNMKKKKLFIVYYHQLSPGEIDLKRN